MTTQCPTIRPDGFRCTKDLDHRDLCRPGACRHGETDDQKSAGGEVIATQCRVCRAVLCLECRRPSFHPPEIAWPDLARLGYCICRPAEVVAADWTADQLSLVGAA